jgi:hypothetical protein
MQKKRWTVQVAIKGIYLYPEFIYFIYLHPARPEVKHNHPRRVYAAFLHSIRKSSSIVAIGHPVRAPHA